LSEKQVKRFVSKGKLVYTLLMLEKGEGETPLHPIGQPPIHELVDVFLLIYP